MRSDPVAVDVVIVGGGFSGTMMAAQLVKRGLTVVLVEARARAGSGTAYSTREAAHLLNVPAARMSAWPDRPDDFIAAGHQARRSPRGATMACICGRSSSARWPREWWWSRRARCRRCAPVRGG